MPVPLSLPDDLYPILPNCRRLDKQGGTLSPKWGRLGIMPAAPAHGREKRPLAQAALL